MLARSIAFGNVESLSDVEVSPDKPATPQPRLSAEELAALPGGARWLERHAGALADSPPMATAVQYRGCRDTLARLAAQHRPMWAFWRVLVAGWRKLSRGC
jgi:hypothetical protein